MDLLTEELHKALLEGIIVKNSENQLGTKKFALIYEPNLL